MAPYLPGGFPVGGAYEVGGVSLATAFLVGGAYEVGSSVVQGLSKWDSAQFPFQGEDVNRAQRCMPRVGGACLE